MKSLGDPQIESVGQTDNAAVIEFRGEETSAIYPARLLHAAKDLANIMYEEDRKAESEQK